MTPHELEQVALAVANGDAVDWSRVLEATGDAAEVRALRLIEAIAAGYGKELQPGRVV